MDSRRGKHYKVELSATAVKQLSLIPTSYQRKISKALVELTYNPLPYGVVKL